MHARKHLLGLASAATLAVSLGACANVPPGAGFPDVETTVAERLDKKVAWNRGSAEDNAAAAAVIRLLEGPLTADAAVQVALLNNRSLQASFEELGVAQADLVQAGLLQNPVFSASALFPGPQYSLSVVQDFLSVFTLAANRRVAATALERAQFDVGNQALDLASEVRTTYYKVLADEQAIEFFRQVVTATEAAAELSQRQFRAGNVGPRDQALLQVQYAQALLELSRNEAEINTDRETLNRLLGLSGAATAAWNLPERLPDVTAAGAPPLDGLEALAVERRLDLAAAQKDVETANYALALGRAYRYLSVLGIGFTYERDIDGKHIKGPSLEFSLPLFDRGQARIAALEAQLRRSEATLSAFGTDVRSQVRESWSRLRTAQERALFYQTRYLPLNQTLVAETQKLYNGMLVGVYDLLLARQNQINAARDYIGALREYWLARSDLERAVAGPLPSGPPSAHMNGGAAQAPLALSASPLSSPTSRERS